MKKKNRMLPVSDMLDIERRIENCVLSTYDPDIPDDELAKKLGLEVEYVDSGVMQDDAEAELAPPVNDECNGVIRIGNEHRGKKFQYTHEIMHYVLDVGAPNKVTRCFARARHGTERPISEQHMDYATAAKIMPIGEIRAKLHEYDTSSPRMDEMRFIRDMCSKYQQDRTAVIRRIQEVRVIDRAKSR